MRFLISVGILVALLLTTSSVDAQRLVPHKAVTKKGDETKLYVATFSADWCESCEGMSDIIQKLRDEGFSVYRFDFDGHRLARLKLAIQRPPTMIIMNKGRVIKRFVGAPEKFLQELRELLQKLTVREKARTTPLDYLLG